MLTNEDLVITSLGKRLIPSVLKLSSQVGDGLATYVRDEDKMRFDVKVAGKGNGAQPDDVMFEQAGPREHMYFDPSQTKAAIVTCGGLSPGLNNVIRSIFREFYYKYNVSEVYGIRFGFKGLNPENGYYPIMLTPRNIEGIHKHGGTVLGSSRGKEDVKIIVDTLDDIGINILICVGGDGTLRGSHAIWEEIQRRNKKIAVIGVPKTIDNDVNFVHKTFGFDTAVGKAREVLDCAHVEAAGAPNGIGVVKVMGRDAGFIAAHATLASLEVNFCLIPEVPFDLYGEGSFLSLLEKRILERDHAVVVVAEGAGQDLFDSDENHKDASGNVLHRDIGLFLKERISAYFTDKNLPINLKYLDPSYFIRSVPANASDCIFCDNLARYAVHAAMAGKTDVVIGLWHGVYVHVPINLATQDRKKISSEGSLWGHVLEVTGQPVSMKATAT